MAARRLLANGRGRWGGGSKPEHLLDLVQRALRVLSQLGYRARARSTLLNGLDVPRHVEERRVHARKYSGERLVSVVNRRGSRGAALKHGLLSGHQGGGSGRVRRAGDEDSDNTAHLFGADGRAACAEARFFAQTANLPKSGPPAFFLTRTDFINKRVYPKEGTRVRIPGTHCIRTQYKVVGH